MNVIKKNVTFKKKKENETYLSKAKEIEGNILLMCKVILQITKLSSFLFTSSFGSFLSANIVLTAVIIAKENDRAVTALRRGDILQGQYPAYICAEEKYIKSPSSTWEIIKNKLLAELPYCSPQKKQLKRENEPWTS